MKKKNSKFAGNTRLSAGFARENAFFRLKRDIVNSAKQEGDGHALAYKWGKPGFDEVNPLDFYWGVCQKCS